MQFEINTDIIESHIFIYNKNLMMFRQSNLVTKLYFATQVQGAQSIAGIHALMA